MIKATGGEHNQRTHRTSIERIAPRNPLSCFSGYAPWVGDFVTRSRGSLVSLDTGEATVYQLENLQERGTLFISPLEPVYNGMIMRKNSRPL